MFEIMAAKNSTSKSKNNDFLITRKGIGFLAPNLIDESETKLIQKYKAELLNAIEAKGMNYT